MFFLIEGHNSINLVKSTHFCLLFNGIVFEAGLNLLFDLAEIDDFLIAFNLDDRENNLITEERDVVYIDICQIGINDIILE